MSAPLRNLLTLIALALCQSVSFSAPPASTLPTTRPLPPPPAPFVLSAPDHPTAIVLHLPGISGYLRIDQRMLRGLREGLERNPATKVRVEVFDWPYYDKGLGALMNERNNRLLADHIATWISTTSRANPGIPIYLTSHSGGGGVLLWALERLPADVSVDQVLLLAPAVSPTYDLSPALRHVRGYLFNFSSTADPVLKMTRAFGTLDRKFTESAGVDGFVTPVTPPPTDPTEYTKLRPMPYRDAYMNVDNLGDHIGPMELAFARQILAPCLTPAPIPPSPATTRPTVSSPPGVPAKGPTR